MFLPLRLHREHSHGGFPGPGKLVCQAVAKAIWRQSHIVGEWRHSSRPTDIADIEQESIRSAIDWELLNRHATAENEAKANALNDRNYLDFLANYDEYVKRFKP